MRRIKRPVLAVILLFAALIVSDTGKARYVGLGASATTAPAAEAATLGMGFTYQGQLTKYGAAITGACNFSFSLWDAAGSGSPPVGGNQVGGSQTINGISVVKGLFTVVLNDQAQFGASAFNGEARWLQISVTCSGDGSATILSPRQAITAAPYAITSPGSPYQNVVIVAKGGGDFSYIQAALDSILDAGPNYPYLVWVAPGVYTETITMKAYVDIEGAGQKMTKITFGGANIGTTGTVITASDAELRSLSVENTGGHAYAVGIYNDGNSLSLKDISVVATADGNISAAVFNDNAGSVLISNSNFLTEGPGFNHYTLYSRGLSQYTVKDSTISAYGGSVLNYGIIGTVSSTANVHSSIVWGITSAIHMLDSTGRIANSQLIGGVSTAGTGSVICVGAYNQSFVALNIFCQ